MIESGGSVNSGDRDMQGFRGAKLRRETRTVTDGGSAGLGSSRPKCGWSPYPTEDYYERRRSSGSMTLPSYRRVFEGCRPKVATAPAECVGLGYVNPVPVFTSEYCSSDQGTGVRSPSQVPESEKGYSSRHTNHHIRGGHGPGMDTGKSIHVVLTDS